MPTIAQGNDEMESKIDWSNAPEDAMVLLKHVRDGAYAVSESYGDGAKTWHWPDPRYSFPLMPSMWRIVAERPATPSWSGEGLPPVGIDIEVLHELYGWIGARVVGQDGEAAIVRTNDGYAGAFQHQMRPIRTPEQIAAELTDQEIKEIAGIICRDGAFDIDDPEVTESAVALYDAGYRKP